MAGFSVVKRGLDAERDGTGLQANVPTVSAGSVTRTKVFQSPAGVGLRDFVSVMDAPFNAVGDGVAIDTAAGQAAVNAVSAAGGGTVVFPAGKTFKLGQVIPKSNVTVWAYGANFTRDPASTFGLFSNAGASTAISNFHLRGGYFTGTGTESANHVVFRVINGTDVSCNDTWVTTWATGPIFFDTCIRVRCNYNTLLTTCTALGTNPINLLIGTTNVSSSAPYHEAVAIGNYIDGTPTEGIALGETGNNSTNALNAVIANNVVLNCQDTAINVEWSTTTTGLASQVVISGNHATMIGSGTTSCAIAADVATAANNDPSVLGRVVIVGNTAVSTQLGIVVNSSDTIVTGNVSSATRSALSVAGVGSFTLTGDEHTSTLLDNLAGTGLANVKNGAQVIAAGVQTGSFIVSGGGTTAYTLSLPETASTAGVAVTVRSPITRVNVTGNVLRAKGNPLAAIASFTDVRDSTFSNNIISADIGSTGSQAGLSLLRCGWMDITGNTIDRAPGHGITLSASNDWLIQGNHIKNPNEGNNASTAGISVASTSGTLYRISQNTIIDDRAAHLMVNAVILQAGALNLVELLDNEMRGASSAPVSSIASFPTIKGNITDLQTWPAATSAPVPGVSPANVPSTALTYASVLYIIGGTATVVQHVRPGNTTRTVWSGAGVAVPPLTLVLQPGDQTTITHTVAPTCVLTPLQL